MAINYTFDDDAHDHSINNGQNYKNQVDDSRGTLPTADDHVESEATSSFFGTITVHRWQFGTLASGGTITADFADEMVIEGHLFVDDAVSLTARGSVGAIDAVNFTGGGVRAEDGGTITVTDSIQSTFNSIGVLADGGTIAVGGNISGADVGSVTANNSGSIDVDGDISTKNISASNDSTIETQNLSVVDRTSVGVFSGATLNVLGSMAWTAASLNDVGIFQGGFDIRDGGTLSVGSSFTFGGTAGVFHDGLLRGTGAKLDFVGTMYLGDEGKGEIRVQDGANQTWNTVIIGAGNGGQGHLSITNTSGPNASTALTTVTIQTLLTLGDVANSTGHVTVAGKFDTLHVDNTLIVGNGGTGDLTVMGGGTVEADTIIVGQGAGSQGTITLMQHADLSSVAVSTLQVGGDGNTGSGSVYVNSNTKLTVTQLEVEAHGSVVLNGTGQLAATHITVATGGGISGNINFAGNVANTFVNGGNVSGIVHLGDGADNYNGAGSSAANVFGDAGNDTLTGGIGIDRLTGGAGLDTLTGGGAGDFFDFNNKTETPRGANHDVIMHFSGAGGEGDKIDLAGIDAKKGGGNQAFKYIGAAKFHHKVGELQVKYNANTDIAIVSGDIDGNGKADFQIEVHSDAALVRGDFVL
jgi:T5SS/PEP-CTERM-associated repeat protein